MGIEASSVLSRHRKSFEAGQLAGEELRQCLSAPPKVLLVHMTVNHEQNRFLDGLRAVVGPEVPILGCSGQGVMGRGAVHEDGYAASVMALGGPSLSASVARVDAIGESTADKARALARELRRPLAGAPRVTILFYDPLTGADMVPFLAGMDEELGGPLIGAAAAHFFSAAMTTTFQYFGTEVFSGGAVALSLEGDFDIQMGCSNGAAPVGLDMTITRASGTLVQELDGRPAMDVWKEVTGSTGFDDPLANSALAIGLPVEGAGGEPMIRAAFVRGEDGLMLQTAAPLGARVTLYHRTTEDVLEGSSRLALGLKSKLAGKTPRAVLGFECGGRTSPFLGTEATNAENVELQSTLGDSAAYGGVVGWGEIYPVGSKSCFHNYAFPLLVLSD